MRHKGTSCEKTEPNREQSDLDTHDHRYEHTHAQTRNQQLSFLFQFETISKTVNAHQCENTPRKMVCSLTNAVCLGLQKDINS